MPRRRRQPSIPPELRRDTVQHVRSMNRKYRNALETDPDLKNRLLRLEKALLLPRPKPRGRPANVTVTRAIALHRRLRRKYPGESSRAIWARVYPRVICDYDKMSEPEQRTAREELQQRVAWRRRRRPRKIAA